MPIHGCGSSSATSATTALVDELVGGRRRGDPRRGRIARRPQYRRPRVVPSDERARHAGRVGGGPEHDVRMLMVSTDEVYGPGEVRRQLFDEDAPLAARQPVRGEQGGRRPPVQRVLVDVRRDGDDRARHERLRAAADRARDADVHDLRARGAAGARVRGRGGATRVPVRQRLGRGGADGARCRGSPASSTTSAAVTSSRTSNSHGGSARSSGAPESQIAFVADRPGHDFRYGSRADRLRGLDGRRECRSKKGWRAPLTGTATTSSGFETRTTRRS